MITLTTSLNCENYYPNEKLKWVKYNSFDTKNLSIFTAHLYNSIKKKKLYSLYLWTIYNELDNSCILLIEGKLKFWFHQEYVKNELTIEEHVECLKLLHAELDLNFKEKRLRSSKDVIIYLKNNEYRYYIYNTFLNYKKLLEIEKMIVKYDR
jgi:hypothetical protein